MEWMISEVSYGYDLRGLGWFYDANQDSQLRAAKFSTRIGDTFFL